MVGQALCDMLGTKTIPGIFFFSFFFLEHLWTHNELFGGWDSSLQGALVSVYFGPNVYCSCILFVTRHMKLSTGFSTCDLMSMLKKCWALGQSRLCVTEVFSVEDKVEVKF